ncbi:zinc uptake transcriptional repressor [Klebsiella michiganensis]|nr:zinc uptake transcriptional repressor [Klebsiella michiganensis]
MDKTTSQQMLAHAEKLCAQRGVRLTPQRLEVLRLMSLQQGAISAYDLLDLLREKEPQAKPPTVYRALEFLLEQGFVHKVESTNSYVLCHLFDQPTHSSAMFICGPLRRRQRRVCGRRRRYYAYAGGKNGIRPAPQRH